MKSRREAKTKRRTANDARGKNLVEILEQALDVAAARVCLLRRAEEADAIALPVDSLDVAHSLEEVEMNAGLIERCEDTLRAIDDAFNRLKRGRYGFCEKCRQEIPIQRLKAMPLAAYCIDCEKEGNERRRPARAISTSHRVMCGRHPKN